MLRDIEQDLISLEADVYERYTFVFDYKEEAKAQDRADHLHWLRDCVGQLYEHIQDSRATRH